MLVLRQKKADKIAKLGLKEMPTRRRIRYASRRKLAVRRKRQADGRFGPKPDEE